MCDCNTIICSSLEEDDTVVLIPNRTIKNLANTGNYRLIIACNLNATENLPVEIEVGENNIPLLCKYGNQVYANMLNKRVNYPLGYGNDNPNYANGQFVILSCNCLNKKSSTETGQNEVKASK